VDDKVKAFARLDGIVTLIDARHIEAHLDAEKPEGAENEAVEQVAFADRLLINKVDLVSEADLERVEARLKSINKFAPSQRCTQASVSVDSVLDSARAACHRPLPEPDSLSHTWGIVATLPTAA
jgi:G3E family GTPase